MKKIKYLFCATLALFLIHGSYAVDLPKETVDSEVTEDLILHKSTDYCWIVSGNQIMLARDAWSHKLFLPTIEATEKILGQNLVPLPKEIGVLGNQKVFNCKFFLPIQVFHVGKKQRVVQNISVKGDFDEIFFIELTHVLPKHLKYPSEWPILSQFFHTNKFDKISTSLVEKREGSSFHVEKGLEVTRKFQMIKSPIFDRFFHFFDFFGEIYFFFMGIPIIILLISKEKGLKLAAVLSFSALLCSFNKAFFQEGRPFDWYSQLSDIMATGFGFPSGHSMLTLIFWGYILIFILKNNWLRSLFIFMMFVTGLGRIYLGVHFVYDVMFGWLLGVGVLTFTYFSEKKKFIKLFPSKISSHWFLTLFIISIFISFYLKFPYEISKVFSVTAGVGIGLWLIQQNKWTIQPTKKIKDCMIRTGTFLLLLGCWISFMKLLSHIELSHQGIIFVKVFSYFAIGIILTAGNVFIFRSKHNS